MSKSRTLIDTFNRAVNSERWKTLSPEQQADYKRKYDAALDRALAEEQQSSTTLPEPTVADVPQPAEPPKSRQIAQKFNQVREQSPAWKSMTPEQQADYTENVKAAHQYALTKEGADQTPDTKLNIQQEVWQPYMPPEEEKRMADPTVGTVGKALGKSLLRAPGNLASTIVGAGGVIADLAGKGLKNIPYLEGVGSKISEVGQDTINVSNTMDAWNKHYIPPEQTAPQNLEEFGDMTWGQKGVFLADQLPEQVATMFLPGMMGAKFGQAAVAGAKGAKAAGVLKPLTAYLTSKGPKAAQALGAFTGSTIQSAAEIGKSQMQEAGDTDALATMIAAPLAGKLESLVPASAEWLSGSFKGASRKAFSEAMKSPVTFLAHVSKEMLKNSTTESVTELMQESIQKYATERAKGERGQGVLDAAAKASNILREKGIDGLIAEAKKNETVGQLAMAAILGGVAGGVFEGTGRSFAGAKYLTSPVRRYDAMVNAQTDEEKKVAAEAWKKLTPAQMQSARQEAAFRTIFELDDDESDLETVKDNFNVLRELGADGYATAAQSAAANGWTPSESYQARMTEFLTENPEFATELEKISGAQAVKTAPKITQEKPYVNLEPKSNISGQNAPAKPQPNVVDLINQIAGGQGDEYDSYAQSLANAQEPDPETKRASAVGGDLETAPGIINAKDYQESPDELTRLFPPEDMFSTGKTEQGEVAAREIPGKGFAGKKTKIRAGDITTDGEYAIVELDSLQRNKQIGELQNRDRTREASQAQIESIAANPDPDMLISSDVFANDGPMVVGPDFVVESGNGRTEGLNLAYQNGSAGKYTQALVQRAAEFGLDPQAISRMKKPVLVRIRTGEVAGNDRSAFVSAANAPRQLQRSATEKAITDGQAILDFVGNLETTGSNINTAANRPFLAEFFNRVATPEERGALFTATGELSQDGLNRVRNAVFSAAYGSPDLLVNLTEDTDSEIKSIINGLLEAAPDTAALSGEAKRGGVHPVSLTSALADAAKKIAGLRQQGQKVEAYFQQGQFGDDKLSPEARMLLGLFSDLGSSKKINDFVRAFNQTVRAYGSPSQMQIPGMESEPPTIREVMTQAIRKTTPELESKIERWVQGPPSLGVEFSRKGQKPVDAGNQKLLDLLERIGQNADPETAQASSKLVNLINSIGDKAPEYMAEGKPAGEKNRDQVKYFSRPKDPGTQAGVISREELENTARTIQANLEPTTGVKVVVLETTDELTEIIQEANPAADPVPSDVEGALFNNTAYLVRNNLPDAKRAVEVAGHEIIGHFGLQAILGREFTSQLVELEKLAETDQQVKAELDRAEKDYFDEDESAAKNRRIALEEALARISEKYAADPDTFGGKVRAWFEQSIGKIRDALRVLGFDIKFTASDLANTIRSSKAAVTRDGSFNSASKGAALDSYEKLAEVDRQFEESGMGEIWRFAKKTASQTLNKEKFRRKLYKNPLWEFLTPEKQQELLENTELYKGGLERRLRQMQNKKIRTRQHKGTSISDMLINKYPETPYAPFMPDSGKASVEAFEIAKEIISNDPTAKVFRGQLDVKNLKTLNDASESETDANNRFLKNFAEYFKEAVDSISNNNLLVKYGGDEWDSFIVVSKEVTEEDVRRYLMVAHKKAVQHAISMGIKETAENPRAPQPRGLGESLAANYKSGYVTPGIEKLVDDYAKDLWKYLTGRGMGFRIGISEVKLDQSFNESAEEISKQHKAEKEGKSLDQKTAEEYRQIIDGNIARIRRGETPIRFSIKKRMAGDVSEGKGSLQEVLVEQRRPGRPGGESGEIRVPGDEGILPSRLEQLIEQIGAELPPQHKETGNKLLDILSSLGGDTVSDDPQFSIKTGSLGKPGFQPMRPVMAGDRNFNRAYGIEPGRGHVYDDANSDEPTVINRTGSSWRTRYQNPGAAAWVRQEELKENARFREEQRQGYGKLEELLEALPEKDISRQAKSKIEEILDALPDESPKYSYAGAKAKRPKGVGSWKNAKAMLDAGEDAEAVRLKTGWFVNQYDQKPRFEIDDSKVELNEQLWQHPALKGRTTFELAGVINHPELFAAYPALKDIMTTIEIDPDKQESGSYLPDVEGDEDYFGREPEIKIVAPDSESAKNSLIHEIQHAIQEEEGFAKGGSPREFLQAEKDKLDMLMERISILNEEMSGAVGTPRYKELMAARNELSNQAVEIQQTWDARGGAYGAAFDRYQRLAGEIEARDSADRMELSQEERRLYPPYSTADYAPDEAIVRFSKKLQDINLQAGDAKPLRLNIDGDNFAIKANAATEINAWPKKITAADGFTVLLKNQEAQSMVERMLHLITDKRKNITPEKAAWLPNVPQTLKFADLKLFDARSDNHAYIRKYADGTEHVVIVRKDGTIEDQTVRDQRLITQFPKRGKGEQDKMEVVWMSEGLAQRAETPGGSTAANPSNGTKRFPENLGPTNPDSTTPGSDQEAFQNKYNPTDNKVKFSKAYHGTPHRGIENEGFKLNKIGSGEGRQAFGWGVYFAGDKGVAEHYRKRLSYQDQVRKFRKELPDNASVDEVVAAARSGRLPETTADVIKALAADDWLGFDYPSQAITAAFKELDNYDASPELLDAIKRYSGQLYHAEIPDAGELLDWDSSFENQPEVVQKALSVERKKFNDSEGAEGAYINQNATGNQIYKEMIFTYGSPQAASERLKELGIPGLQYLDGISRESGEGNRNYVVWDESRLNNEVTPYYSKKGGDLADQLDPNPEPPPTLTEESKSQASKVYKAIHQIASGLMGKTVSQRDLEDPAFKRSQSFDPEAETDFEIGRKHKISAGVKSKDSEDKTILSHLDADKNLIIGMIRKIPESMPDLRDWLLKKAARVLAPYQAAKPIERILFTVGENIAWDGKKIVASPGIRSYNPETGEYEYKPSEHAAAAMHFFNMLSPEWQELMTERAKANEEYRQNFVNVVIPHRKAQTAIALLARYRQMGADRTALEGAEAEARSMLKALDGKIDQAEHNELKSLLEEVVSIPADRINKMVVRMESIIKQATGELKTPAQLQRALKSLNTNRGHYGYVHHFFESDRVPSQGKAFDAFGRVPNGWIEDVPGTQKIRTGAEGNKRNLLEADIAKEAKEAKAEAANNWMRDIEDQRGLLVEEFEDIPDDQMPEGYVGYENERPFRRRVFANFGKYRGQEIYLPVKTFDSYKLVKEKGVDDPSMKEFGETIAMLDGVANRMNEAMLYHTGKFARDLLSAPFHIIEFVRDWSFTSPTEIPFVIKALTKAIASQASAKTWQKSTPESHGEYSESLPYQNKSDKKSFLTRAGDAIGRLITKDLPVGSTVAAMLKEINLSGAADLPLKRIFESVGEQLAERRGLKGKARERFVYDMINQYAFVTQDLPPWLAWLRGQMPSKESRGAGAIMRLTIPFLGYSSRLAKQMLADPVSKGLLPMAKRLIGKKDADANFLREFSEASRPFFWLFFKSLVASGLGGLLPPEEEGIASDIQDAENLNPLARTHGRILWSQDDDPKGGENWLSVKGLGHLQVADALSDVVAGKSSVSDLSTEFLTIHPAMSWILGSVGVENPYDAKVPKGARAGRMLAQALVPQLTRYGPEMGKFFRAAAGNNTIPDAQKQSFFTAFFEQLGIPAGEVKVDRDGKLRTTRTALELLKQVGVNMRHIPYDMIAEAVDSELGSAKYYTDRLEMIQEYRDGDRDTDLSEREFIAQTLQTNKWTKIDDAERDMTKALVDRGQGALATLAKLRQKGVPVNAKPPKKKKDKGFGGSFGGKKFGGGFGSSFKKSPESKREEKVSDLEKKIQEIQSNQPKPKSWHDQLLDVIKSI